MEPLADIPGLRLITRRAPGIAGFEARPDADASAIVAAIQNGWSLSIFDGTHPSISDPGAYLAFYRREGTIRSQAANHGWSSGWIDLPDRDAAALLAYCLAGAPAEIYLTTTGRRDWPGDGRSAERFSQYVAARLAGVEPDD